MFIGNVYLLGAFVALLSQAAPLVEIGDDLQQGQLMQSRGQFARAEQHFEAALQKSRDFPEQLAAISNLASLETELWHLDRAAELYGRAIGMLNKNGGDVEPEIQKLRTQLAELYLEIGDISTAKALLKRVIAARKAHRMIANADTALALGVLACVYAYEKDATTAEQAERESLSMLETVGKHEDAAFAIGTLHLATFLNQRKHPSEALPYAERSLTMFRKLPVLQPAMEGAAEIALASVYAQLRRAAEAQSSAEIAYLIVERYYGADHPKTATILLAQAGVLRTIGRNSAARQLQERAEKILAAYRQPPRLASTVPLQALLPK
jgi:tetratricopeptide (TPR) repeat protein